MCPGWPPDVSVCRARGLLFVGAMCSHVDCLSPPILLLNHCFSGSSNDVRSFAVEFSGAAEGLGYNDEALKDLFNSALDEPLS